MAKHVGMLLVNKYNSLTQRMKVFNKSNSLSRDTADRLDTGADWRVLALSNECSQAKHGSRADNLRSAIFDLRGDIRQPIYYFTR